MTTTDKLRTRIDNVKAVLRNSGEARLMVKATLAAHPRLPQDAVNEITWNAANTLLGMCPDGCCGGAEMFDTYEAFVLDAEARADTILIAEGARVTMLRVPTALDERALQAEWDSIGKEIDNADRYREFSNARAFEDFCDAEDTRLDNAIERSLSAEPVFNQAQFDSEERYWDARMQQHEYEEDMRVAQFKARRDDIFLRGGDYGAAR